MGLHKHEPINEGFMYRQNGIYTICEVLRQAYWMTEDPEIRIKLRIAVNMAKSMVQKLRAYKADWDKDGFWENTPEEPPRRHNIKEVSATLGKINR